MEAPIRKMNMSFSLRPTRILLELTAHLRFVLHSTYYRLVYAALMGRLLKFGGTLFGWFVTPLYKRCVVWAFMHMIKQCHIRPYACFRVYVAWLSSAVFEVSEGGLTSLNHCWLVMVCCRYGLAGLRTEAILGQIFCMISFRPSCEVGLLS